MKFFALTTVCLLSLATLPAAEAADITGNPRVIDGDTLDVSGQRIRLHGIDTPEIKQTCTENGKPWNCGEMATFALVYMTAEHWVSCEEKGKDRYGRIVAVCYVGSYDLGAEMVRQGWALAYRHYSMDYVSEEAEAMAAGAGLWRGEFVAPWEWRRK